LNRLYIGFLITIFLVTLSVLIAASVLGNSNALIISDGKGYYSWLRSLMLDGDINFENDYRLIFPPDILPEDLNRRTPNGLIPNKYPIGLAILELPGFLIGHAIANLSGFEANGITLPYQLSVTLSLTFFVLVSFYLLYLALQNYGIQQFLAMVICVMALIATNLIHYVAKESAMVHASNVTLTNILIFLSSIRPLQSNSLLIYQLSTRLLIGLLIGWLIINRNTNVVLLPFLGFVFLRTEKFSWKSLFPYGLGIGFMVSLQQIVLYSLWGGPKAYSYDGEIFTGEWAGVFGTLFGEWHGLFIYHPWYLVLLGLNVWGLFKNERFQQIWNFWAIMAFISLWTINGNWWAWYFGDSFGNRAFIEVLIPLTTGAAFSLNTLCDRLSWKQRFYTTLLLILLISINLYTWVGYLLKRYPHAGNLTKVVDVYFWILK
jgi:hypothetical protein